jgi:hypothetical protein
VLPDAWIFSHSKILNKKLGGGETPKHQQLLWWLMIATSDLAAKERRNTILHPN